MVVERELSDQPPGDIAPDAATLGFHPGRRGPRPGEAAEEAGPGDRPAGLPQKSIFPGRRGRPLGLSPVGGGPPPTNPRDPRAHGPPSGRPNSSPTPLPEC